jgi:hypothetical protein
MLRRGSQGESPESGELIVARAGLWAGLDDRDVQIRGPRCAREAKQAPRVQGDEGGERPHLRAGAAHSPCLGEGEVAEAHGEADERRAAQAGGLQDRQVADLAVRERVPGQ